MLNQRAYIAAHVSKGVPMSLQSAPKHFIGAQEYLDGGRHGELRHEYVDGQVYAMSGASRAQGLIVNALAYAMTPAARRKGCQLFTSDMKLRLDIGGKTIFYYPDLLLSCDPQDREPYFSCSPCLIVEVLSESTVRIDRRKKSAGLPDAAWPAGVSAGGTGRAARGAVPPCQ